VDHERENRVVLRETFDLCKRKPDFAFSWTASAFSLKERCPLALVYRGIPDPENSPSHERQKVALPLVANSQRVDAKCVLAHAHYLFQTATQTEPQPGP